MRELPGETRSISTLHGVGSGFLLDGTRVLCVAILRAGLGMLPSLLRLLPGAPVGLIRLRRVRRAESLEQYAEQLPRDPGGPMLVVDPMLATGASAVRALDVLNRHGIDDGRIRLLCAVCAPEGLARLAERHPRVAVFAAALDEGLNERHEIVPGIGDAGDWLFGTE